jgi:hypothetical protein
MGQPRRRSTSRFSANVRRFRACGLLGIVVVRIRVLRAPILSVMALVLLAFAQRVQAQCGGTQLCAPGQNPCVVSGSCTLTSGTTFDLDGRDLTFAAGARVTVPGNQGGGSIEIINVGDVAFGSDARITAASIEEGGSGFSYKRGQTFKIVASGRIELAASPKVAQLLFSGSHEGGQIFLDAGTDLVMNGFLDVSASNGGGYGGSVDLVARTGSITIGGSGIDADGGNTINDDVDSSGGFVSAIAAQNLTLAAPIESSGGDCSFCSITLVAQGGNLVTTSLGEIESRATGSYGGGAEIEIVAGGSVTTGASILASGRGSAGELEGGSGGLVSIMAGADVTIGAAIDLRAHQSASIPDGDGGELAVEAPGEVRIAGPITLTGPGSGSTGGIFNVTAGPLLEVSKVVDASGGSFGGDVELWATGTIDVTPTGQLLVQGGDSTFDGAGSMKLTACIVRLQSTSVAVRSVVRNGGYVDGPDAEFGSNLLQVGQSCELSGQLLAPTGSNVVVRRPGVPQCSVNGATFDITPSPDYGRIEDIDELPCCGAGCQATTTIPPSTTTTSTTAPTSTTTTTTDPVATTTTTTAAPATTTTTTTEPGATTTTTTTEPGATTTTTSLAGTSTTQAPVTTTTTSTAPAVETTTTTLEPDPCAAPATSYDAAQCGLGALDEVLATNAVDDLGGTKLVTKLGRFLDRAEAALVQAATVKKPKAKLRRARAQLRAFERAVRKAAKKNKVRADLANAILALTAGTSGQLDALRAGG